MPSLPSRNKVLTVAAKITQKHIFKPFGAVQFRLISLLCHINFVRDCNSDYALSYFNCDNSGFCLIGDGHHLKTRLDLFFQAFSH